MYFFWVQLRGPDLKLLPGIDVFDLGPKLGENAGDIGAMSLTNVRIPREHLFAKRPAR